MSSLKYYFLCQQAELQDQLADACYRATTSEEIQRIVRELKVVTAKLETMED